MSGLFCSSVFVCIVSVCVCVYVVQSSCVRCFSCILKESATVVRGTPMFCFSNSIYQLMSANRRLYKTVLCRNWVRQGQCHYEDSCRFAHGPEELRHHRQHKRRRHHWHHRAIPTAPIILATSDANSELEARQWLAGLNFSAHDNISPSVQQGAREPNNKRRKLSVDLCEGAHCRLEAENRTLRRNISVLFRTAVTELQAERLRNCVLRAQLQQNTSSCVFDIATATAQLKDLHGAVREVGQAIQVTANRVESRLASAA